MPPMTTQPPVDDPVGLCAHCLHARRHVSARGSVFWQCALAQRDPRFARYPRLPMRSCAGYEAAHQAHCESAP